MQKTLVPNWLGCLSVLAVVGTVTVVPRPARACECNDGVYVEVPGTAATDSVIVVSGYEMASLEFDLVDVVYESENNPDAHIDVEVVRTIDSDELCSGAFAFLRPARPLDVLHTYDVRATRAGEQLSSGGLSRFVASEVEPPPAARAEQVQTWLFSQTTTTPSDLRMLDLYAATESEEPILLVAAGELGDVAKLLKSNAPQPAAFALGLVDCAAFELVSMRGETLLGGERCDPDRCWSSDVAVGNSCSPNYGSGLSWLEWQDQPTCAEAVEQPGSGGTGGGTGTGTPGSATGGGTGTGMQDAGGDAPPAVDGKLASGGGCAMARGAGGGAALTLLLLAMVLAWAAPRTNRLPFRPFRASPEQPEAPRPKARES